MRTRSRPASKAFMRALQESRLREPNPFEDAARGRDPVPAKRKRGRPFITEPRPWEVAGISRRTWYRKEKGK